MLVLALAAVRAAAADVKCTQDAACVQSGDRCVRRARCLDGVCLHAFVSCGDGQACMDGRCVRSPLRFTLELPSQKPIGCRSAISASVWAKLTNVSAATIAVSRTWSETISIEAVSDDGKRLEPTVLVINPEWRYHPRRHAPTPLTLLHPGEPLPLVFAELLRMTFAAALRDQTYVPHSPGRYRVRLVYHYAGSDQGLTNVFHGVVRSNEVALDLVGPCW